MNTMTGTQGFIHATGSWDDPDSMRGQLVFPILGHLTCEDVTHMPEFRALDEVLRAIVATRHPTNDVIKELKRRLKSLRRAVGPLVRRRYAETN